MLFDKVRDLIAEQFAVEANSVNMETCFEDDLGADSLDVVELTMALEGEFALPEVPEDDLRGIATVRDLVEYVGRYVQD